MKTTENKQEKSLRQIRIDEFNFSDNNSVTEETHFRYSYHTPCESHLNVHKRGRRVRKTNE
jgi:hypothetical protein